MIIPHSSFTNRPAKQRFVPVHVNSVTGITEAVRAIMDAIICERARNQVNVTQVRIKINIEVKTSNMII
jgi:hypothetical protein